MEPREMWTGKARAEHRIERACHRHWAAYGKPTIPALPSTTRGGSRMRESRKRGFVREAHSDIRPYCDPHYLHGQNGSDPHDLPARRSCSAESRGIRKTTKHLASTQPYSTMTTLC